MKAVTKFNRFMLILGCVSILCSCGGGSNEDGMLIEGQLTQGETAGHLASANLRHGAGENIGEVTICTLGECSVTDSQGQWGFVVDPTFNGGSTTFTIKGHGIDAVSTLSIPVGSNSVYIHFEHGEENQVSVHHLIADGQEIEQEGHHE